MAAANSFHFNHNPSSDDHDKGAPSSSNNGRGLVQYPDQLPESNITPPPVAPGSSHAVISAENPPPTTTSATNYNVVDDGFSPTVPTLSDQANRISTTAAPSPSDAVLSTERPPPTSATTLSTVSTLPDQAKMIMPAAHNIKPAVAVDEDNMDSNQHRITIYEPPLPEIKEGKNPSQIEQNLRSSVSVKNFRGLVSKVYNAAKDFFEDSSVKTRSFVESVGTAAANPFHFNYNPSSDDNDKGAPSSSNNGRGLAQNLDQLPQSNITPLMHAVISAEKPTPTTTSDTNDNVVDDGFSPTVPMSSDQANRISTTAAPSPSDAVMSTERPPSTSTTSPSDAVMSTERPPSTSTTTINGSSPTDMSTERPPPTSATTLSTASTLPDPANTIITAANNFKAAFAEVNEDNRDSYLDLLIEHIARLCENKEGKSPSQIEQNLPSSESVQKFKDFFSAVIDGVKNFFEDSTAKALARGLLKGVGMAHFALAGLVGVAYILEMSEIRSANENESLRGMKDIYRLANHIRSLRHCPQLKQEMENEIREATVLIMEGSILCCTMIKSPGLFSEPAKKAELVEFKQKLEDMEKSISRKIEQTSPPPFNDSHPPAEMEKQIEEVTGLLKGERDGTALTVILHGHEGMGKTTLGNAVYAACSKRYKSFKYSKVTLFEDQDKTRTILKAQKLILRDLRGTKMIPEIRNHKDGQDLLHETLKEVAAFIFIDNNANLGENELSKLLPEDMGEAKNVRLLLTASNTNVGTAWPMKTPPKIHTMKYLSDKEAKSLLKRDIEEGLSDGQFTEIIEKCCGIPMMLMLVGKFIRAAPEKLEAYKQFIKDKDYETEPLYTMERYLLRYLFDHLPCICREPFLDICFFFRGWDWNTVKGIVGKQALDSLEARALLTKDSNGAVSVHNVILSLVKKKETETRFKLTNAGQIEELPEKDIKGIWVENEDTDLFRKLATKLNSMSKSLRVLKLGNSRGVDINCDEAFGKLIFFQGAVPRLPFDLQKYKELKYLSYQPTDSKFSEMLPLNLTHIEFDGSSNKHDFQIYCDNLHKLKELRILKFIQFANLRTLPNQLGDAVNGLQELTLSKCGSIEELPQSITKLQSLQKINLHGCKNLKRLPRGFEKLSSLTLLDLSFCEKLLKLPHRIGYMEKLGKLSCNNCSSLTRIPESIGMNSFTKLDMSGCSSLRELPSLFVSLEKLISLNLSECSSLEKLPQGFGKLKCLVKLNLSKCSTLKQLCYDFHCLSSLEMLDLSQCERLEELPQNFDRLLRLKHLYLSFCYKLEGKWMKSLENMKTLRIINIKGSSLLKKGWKEILEERNQPCSFAEPCSFAVSMEDLPSAEEKENIQKRLLSKLDHFLIDKQGNFISSLPRGTTLLFMFHSDPDHDFPFPLIEEAIDDNQNGLDFKMFYIGKHFNKLNSKVKDNISGYSDDILEFGESWLSTLDANVRESWLKSYNAEEPIYLTRENESWTVLSKRKLEAFVFRHCEKYNELVKYLSKRPSEQSNLYLLRELFATREEEDVIFLKKYASDKDPAEHLIHRVDELKGKTILLEMGCEELCDDIGRSVLTKLYLSKEDSLKLEIISIPMVDSKVKVNERFSEKVPWLVLRNPLAIARAARYFLVADCGWTGDHLWYGSMFWIIEPDRTISICTPFMLFMLSMWPKPETFPQKIFEELPSKEWNRLNTVSDLEFLFSHLEHVSNQVKGIRKLKCIYVGNKKVTCSLRNASIELKDNIHIIYIPRYAHKKEMSRFTDSIYKNYNSWEKPKMQLEDEMDGMPLLNLSEDDSMRFWMRILFLKEEIEKRQNINGIDNNGMMQVRQMKTLLHPFLLMEEEQSVVFMDEYGKMIATCRGDVMEWIFKEDGEDRAKRLIKQLVKASKVERESSIAVSMPAVPVAVQQENVNDLDNLSQYTSDLLEMVQLYQLLNFNKEGSESATPKVDRPVSIGFQRLNNFPFEGTSRIVQNINPEHPRGDILEILLERVRDEELAAAAVLVVADILERFKNISAECLILLEEMNRLSQYIKDLNGQPEKMRRATKWLVHCYIMCCAQIEPSKFATFFKGSVNGRKVLGLQQWLRRSQEELRKWKWAEAT